MGFAGAAAPRLVTPVAASSVAMGIADLEKIGKEQNPLIGYWDPLNLGLLNFWGQGEEATVGFLRHAEIKHGRVAMAAFVGYCVQANGIRFPWDPVAGGMPAGLSPPEQWDAMPLEAKLQIILFIGILEGYSEHSFILEKSGEKHYMKGGKPGFFPPTDNFPHPVGLNLYDPFNNAKGMSEEVKAKRRNIEINNGRLAMIGIMGFVAEATVPGSVPFGPHLAPYAGNVMIPFA